MPRFILAACSCLLIELLSAPALADTWCSTNFPDAIFCDDFDGYPDFGVFINAWVPTGDVAGYCSSFLTPDTDFFASPPWSAKMNTQQNGDLGYSVNPISNEIKNVFGPEYSLVMGTDLNPLVLEAYMIGKAKYDTSFLTLAAGAAAAPTDWIYSDWCDCPSFHPHYPVICQQETPAPACPPIGTASDVPAIAVGFLAYLDNNPCHCGEPGDQSPYNDHLSFFDGHKWYKLRQGLFTGSGDFKVRPSNRNFIRVTIKSTTIKVELTCPDTSEYSWCQIPGAYTGPFNSLATGFEKSCELKTAQWECRSEPSCDGPRGVPGGGAPRYDNIVLHGGICYAPAGVCCKPDTTCFQTSGACECQSQGGQFAGSGTTCADTACCPPQPGDHDLDGDVDMADFGWFQTCLSGTDVPAPAVACQCVDFNDDGDVDVGDVTSFLGCMLGADVPANPACVN